MSLGWLDRSYIALGSSVHGVVGNSHTRIAMAVAMPYASGHGAWWGICRCRKTKTTRFLRGLWHKGTCCAVVVVGGRWAVGCVCHMGVMLHQLQLHAACWSCCMLHSLMGTGTGGARAWRRWARAMCLLILNSKHPRTVVPLALWLWLWPLALIEAYW
jgi:hypothetical protein